MFFFIFFFTSLLFLFMICISVDFLLENIFCFVRAVFWNISADIWFAIDSAHMKMRYERKKIMKIIKKQSTFNNTHNAYCVQTHTELQQIEAKKCKMNEIGRKTKNYICWKQNKIKIQRNINRVFEWKSHSSDAFKFLLLFL